MMVKARAWAAWMAGVGMVPALVAPALGESALSAPGQYAAWGSPAYDGYQMSSEYVTMRDGTRIAIDIFRPTKAGVVEDARLPVVWMNTPYDRRGHEGGFTASDYPGAALSLTKYGYVVAVADMRGTGASFGRALHSNRTEWAPWARTDAYDITEWLAQLPYSDSKIGMWGCSATGHSQWQAAAMKPPHLKVIFPMSAPSEYYDWNGVTAAEEGKSRPWPAANVDAREAKAAVPVDADKDRTLLAAALDEHRWGLDYGAIPYRDSASPELEKRLGIKNWKPWLEVSTLDHLAQVNAAGIPAYQSANYGEDQRVKLGIFIKQRNVTAPVKTILGPSNHCQWTSEFRSVKDNPFNITIELLRWYDYWLKSIDNGIIREPSLSYYTYNTPEGHEWSQAWQWPLPTARATRYYFNAAPLGEQGAALSLDAPKGGRGEDHYQVDYSVDRVNRIDKGFQVTSAPMPQDMQFTGSPVLHVWIKSTAPDGDFFASLADVAPDGKVTQLPGSEDGQLRASVRKLNKPTYDNLGLPYHRAFKADAAPLTVGRPTSLEFDLAPMSWVFKAGHRLKLVLTNAAPPRHAGAPSQTKVFDPAPVITYMRDAAHPSYISMPLIGQIQPVTRKVAKGVELIFPSSLDIRYLKDIDSGSLLVGGHAVDGWRLSGHRLMLTTKHGGSGALVTGRFGHTYDYGDRMRFAAVLR